ncbi:unnamed protein product [Pleuronectes platessa]|uniref:Uncharacterized protein n=1 Tax=Pleuronectes platessa TaxID=8262 RepID=A0A9N7Z8V2_PLEPL|nr:unnamed protein product [Pleuronectes platessa]
MKQGAEVRLAMMDIDLQRPGATRGTVGQLLNSEDRQTLVWIVLEKVISKAIKGASGSRASNVENTVTRLLEKTWVEVKDFHFEITIRSFGLHRAIYADLLKKFGSAQVVLIALQRTDSSTEQEVVSTVAYHLTKPKPKGMVHRFFSFMGKEAVKLFTSTKRKLVLIMSTVCKGAQDVGLRHVGTRQSANAISKAAGTKNRILVKRSPAKDQIDAGHVSKKHTWPRLLDPDQEEDRQTDHVDQAPGH